MNHHLFLSQILFYHGPHTGPAERTEVTPVWTGDLAGKDLAVTRGRKLPRFGLVTWQLRT